jgi:two-component system phosphate regulon sensor histidine kinase PhoR
MVTGRRKYQFRRPGRLYPLLSGLLAMVFTGACLTAFLMLGFDHTLLNYTVLGLLAATGTFLIIRFFFIRYLEKNISPILKILQSYTMSPGKLREAIDKGDVISDLNNEAEIWADNQTEEIKKLRKLEKYRKDFLGNVSHELKTPIFNIQGYLLTLMDGGMEDASVNKLYLKRAEKSINRLINILEDLDSISRLESGEFKLKPEVFNLSRVIEEVIEDHEMAAGQSGIRLVFESSSGKSVKVLADRKRMTEVISNLVNNSIKYGREGGKTTIGITEKGKNVFVEISDNGVGIEEKDLPRIFERFFRVDKSRSRESGGTGLGLSIVKHILQAHNQAITVRSKVDEGTTFIFSLDRA